MAIREEVTPEARNLVDMAWDPITRIVGNLGIYTKIDFDNREVVDIAQLNAELKTTVARIDQLRKDIDAIVAEIEGEELKA